MLRNGYRVNALKQFKNQYSDLDSEMDLELMLCNNFRINGRIVLNKLDMRPIISDDCD